jgi:acyl-CoA synthetase (AMP-forming)/AMP-acid ligase II
MPVSLLKRALKTLGNVFVQLYGFTEQAGAVTCLDKLDHRLDRPENKIRIASCGKEMPGNDVRVVDGEGREVAPGEVGEIIVRGDNLMRGYWKEPEQTQQLLKDGWFYSGDLATRDEEGYIYIKGRKKEVIISGGENIYPREVEEVIYLHPKVKEVAVIGVPDPQWGEAVKAIVVLKEGRQATAREIIGWCKKNLASYKKPRIVEFIKELPLISLGKIAKQELKKRYGQRQGM